MKAKLDKILNKFISKKLTVFIIATIFVYFSKIDPDQWMQLAVAYIGIQGFLDMVIAYKK